MTSPHLWLMLIKSKDQLSQGFGQGAIPLLESCDCAELEVKTTDQIADTVYGHVSSLECSENIPR